MNEGVKLLGFKELTRQLGALPDELHRKVVMQALRSGGRVVKSAAIANAKRFRGGYSTGNISRNIAVLRDKDLRGGATSRFGVIVRVRRLSGKQIAAFKQSTGQSSRANRSDPYYWWWVEFGTSKMRAQPFMRPAFDSTKTQQLAAIRNGLVDGLRKAAERIKSTVNRESGR